MKWSTALTLSRCGETPSLFITTPLASAGPLWPKVCVGLKNPGRWPRGSTDESRSSPGSDSGNTTGPGTHYHARFWPDSGNTANVLCFRTPEDSSADAESIPPPPSSSFQLEADLRKISRQPQSTYRYLKVVSVHGLHVSSVCASHLNI